MVLLSMENISKDDHALIKVLRHEKNWSSRRLLKKFSGKNCVRTSVDRLLNKTNSTGVAEHPKGSGRPRSVNTLEFPKTSKFWKSSFAVIKVLCTPTEVHTKTVIR